MRAATFSCPFAGNDHSCVSDTVSSVTLLRSLPWHWLLQQLKSQKHKGTAESTAWNSSLCTAQPLTPYLLHEKEVQRGQERGRSGERDIERREGEKREKNISVWQGYFGSILELKCLLSTTHTMCFWRNRNVHVVPWQLEITVNIQTHRFWSICFWTP